MADTLQFDLLAPDQGLASCPASQVDLPGAEGDFAVLPNHMPLVAALRPGVVRVQGPGGETSEFVVTGGYVEVSAETTMVLAAEAFERSSVTGQALQQFVDAARSDAEGCEGLQKDRADKHLNDLIALEQALGAN